MNSQEEMIKRTLELVSDARDKKIVLRIVAGCAIHVHCPGLSHIQINVFGRRFRDADFICHTKQLKQIIKFFEEFGYVFDKYRSSFSESSIILFGRDEHVDVFLDKLAFNHTINLQNRLEMDYPTIALADLLLQKLQIVEINEKDLQDLFVLLAEHDVGSSDNETIDEGYIAKLLSSDWGFYKTCETNMVRLRDDFLEKSPVSDEMKLNVRGKVNAILAKMAGYPKSRSWQMRAKVGTRVKWYTEVEEHIR